MHILAYLLVTYLWTTPVPLWTSQHVIVLQTEEEKKKNNTSKLVHLSFMPLNCGSLIVTSGQVLEGVRNYGCSSRNSCSYHCLTSVFSPSLRRIMWRDEIKAYQVDKSIQLVALLWHEALKARNLFLCVQERAHFIFFFPRPFWDCQSVLDWGWWEPQISTEKRKKG